MLRVVAAEALPMASPLPCETAAVCRTPEKTAPPPFPLRTVGLLLLITLADSIVITFLMPMVPYMVRNYGVAEEDVGFFAGSLASAYNLAGLFSGCFWGRMSDTYGRRPVLLFGLLSTGATVVWFGLAGTAPHHPTAPSPTLPRPRPPHALPSPHALPLRRSAQVASRRPSPHGSSVACSTPTRQSLARCCARSRRKRTARAPSPRSGRRGGVGHPLLPQPRRLTRTTSPSRPHSHCSRRGASVSSLVH